jgi:hypothetical protein
MLKARRGSPSSSGGPLRSGLVGIYTTPPINFQFSVTRGPGCVRAANERTLPELIEHFSDKPRYRKSGDSGVHEVFATISVNALSNAVPGPNLRVAGGVLSPDGKRLACEEDDLTGRAKLILLDLANKLRRELLTLAKGERFPCCLPFTWAPDSRRLLAVRGNADARAIWIIDTESGEARSLPISKPGLANPDLARDGRRLLFQAGGGATSVPPMTARAGDRRNRDDEHSAPPRTGISAAGDTRFAPSDIETAFGCDSPNTAPAAVPSSRTAAS